MHYRWASDWPMWFAEMHCNVQEGIKDGRRLRPGGLVFNRGLDAPSGARFFLLFLFDDRRIRIRPRTRWWEGFSYYFCLMIEGSGSGSGSMPLTNGSGRRKNMWIQWIRNHLGGPGNGGVGEDLGHDDGKVVLHAANDCHAQVVRRVLQHHHLHITPQQSVNASTAMFFLGYKNILWRGIRIPKMYPDLVRKIKLLKQKSWTSFQRRTKKQCCGAITFWCGSGSADPCLWVMDPDPAICIMDLQDANKKLIFSQIFPAYFF